MAFTELSTNPQGTTANGTTHATTNLGATPASGNLLIVVGEASVATGVVYTAQSGLTKQADLQNATNRNQVWFWKICDGTEGTTPTFCTTDVSTTIRWHAWLFSADNAISIDIDPSGAGNNNDAAAATTNDLTTSSTTGAANTLAISCLTLGGTVTGITGDADWTESIAHSSTRAATGREDVASSGVSVQCAWTWTTSRATVQAIGTWKEAGAAAGQPIRLRSIAVPHVRVGRGGPIRVGG